MNAHTQVTAAYIEALKFQMPDAADVLDALLAVETASPETTEEAEDLTSELYARCDDYAKAKAENLTDEADLMEAHKATWADFCNKLEREGAA